MAEPLTRRTSASDPPIERERLYTDKEIGELIKLATERQEDAEALSSRGLPLSEVERIAAEVGIHPRHVRAAAGDLEGTHSSAVGSRLTGRPFVMDQRRVVEGTLSAADWGEIVQELRVRLGGTGRVEQVGETWEWTRQVRDLDLVLSETQVRMRPDADQTTIDMRTHYGGGATVAYLGGIVLSGTAAAVFLDGAGLSSLTNSLILGASGAGGLVAARASIAAWSQRRRRTLRSVINWLDDRIAATRLPPSESPSFQSNYATPEPPSALPKPGSLPPESGE